LPHVGNYLGNGVGNPISKPVVNHCEVDAGRQVRAGR
jgi:hypothetical protein